MAGRPAGRVLITASDAAVIPGQARALVIGVPRFSTRETLNYLSGRLSADPDQRSGAIDLAGALGCEPDALAQATAVITGSGIRCREYRTTPSCRRRSPRQVASRPPRPGSPGPYRPVTPSSRSADYGHPESTFLM